MGRGFEPLCCTILNKDAINKLCWSPLDSAGFRRSLVIPLDSARVWLFQWIPLESSGLAQQKKSGRIPQTPLEYAGFRWTPPDSSRNKYANLALVTPRHSGIPGFSGREGGGVYSPPSADSKSGSKLVIR